MMITGLFAGKGLEGLHAMHRHAKPGGAPRVWVVMADRERIEVWGKGEKGFDMMAAATSNDPAEKFAVDFASWLLLARDQDAVDRIVLLASREMLKIFHQTMPTEILACLAAEIEKDIAGLSAEDRKRELEKLYPSVTGGRKTDPGSRDRS